MPHTAISTIRDGADPTFWLFSADALLLLQRLQSHLKARNSFKSACIAPVSTVRSKWWSDWAYGMVSMGDGALSSVWNLLGLARWTGWKCYLVCGTKFRKAWSTTWGWLDVDSGNYTHTNTHTHTHMHMAYTLQHTHAHGIYTTTHT